MLCSFKFEWNDPLSDALSAVHHHPEVKPFNPPSPPTLRSDWPDLVSQLGVYLLVQLTRICFFLFFWPRQKSHVTSFICIRKMADVSNIAPCQGCWAHSLQPVPHQVSCNDWECSSQLMTRCSLQPCIYRTPASVWPQPRFLFCLLCPTILFFCLPSVSFLPISPLFPPHWCPVCLPPNSQLSLDSRHQVSLPHFPICLSLSNSDCPFVTHPVRLFIILCSRLWSSLQHFPLTLPLNSAPYTKYVIGKPFKKNLNLTENENTTHASTLKPIPPSSQPSNSSSVYGLINEKWQIGWDSQWYIVLKVMFSLLCCWLISLIVSFKPLGQNDWANVKGGSREPRWKG